MASNLEKKVERARESVEKLTEKRDSLTQYLRDQGVSEERIAKYLRIKPAN